VDLVHQQQSSIEEGYGSEQGGIFLFTHMGGHGLEWLQHFHHIPSIVDVIVSPCVNVFMVLLIDGLTKASAIPSSININHQSVRWELQKLLIEYTCSYCAFPEVIHYLSDSEYRTVLMVGTVSAFLVPMFNVWAKNLIGGP